MANPRVYSVPDGAKTAQRYLFGLAAGTFTAVHHLSYRLPMVRLEVIGTSVSEAKFVCSTFQFVFYPKTNSCAYCCVPCGQIYPVEVF